MFNKIRSVFAGLIMLAAACGSAWAAGRAYDVINDVSKQLFPKLSAIKSDDQQGLKNIVVSDLMPYVDIKYAAYKVMGANIRSTNEDQRKRFVGAFETYIVDTYSAALGKYDQQTIKVDPKTVGDAKSTVVNVSVNTKTGEVYRVAFKLRQNQKTQEWKVYDMVAEGISLLSSKQAEFNDLIAKNGIDKVCEMLEQHNLPSPAKK